MISYLLDKFAREAYNFVEIYSQALAESKTEESLPCDETIVESKDFPVARFATGSETLKTSPHLCDLCVLKYGSCKLFKEYEVIVIQLTSTLL